jgi:hypothetical protein
MTKLFLLPDSAGSTKYQMKSRHKATIRPATNPGGIGFEGFWFMWHRTNYLFRRKAFGLSPYWPTVVELLPYGSFVARVTLRGKLFPCGGGTPLSHCRVAGIACPLNFSTKKPTNGGMIKDKSAVSDPERRYAFMQAVGRGNVADQRPSATEARHGTGA